MNNTASLQGRQQQRQCAAGLMSRKQQEEQYSHSPMPLTKLIPLPTFQLEISWLKAVAPSNMAPCDSRRSIVVLLFIIGVVEILVIQKNGVRLLV